jgi:molecular chaperone GrpE (heat shock protein)
MTSKGSGDDADRMFSAMDFGKMMDVAGAVAAQNEKHRKETADLLLGFLEVVDSLEALGAHCQELVEGGCEHIPLNTTLRQALSVLSRAGVEQMNAAGRPLNLAEHEVEAVRTNTSAEEDTVLEEKLRGYLWNGTLLRRAKVVVAQ